MQYTVTEKVINELGTFVKLQSTNSVDPNQIEVLQIQLTPAQDAQITYGDTVSMILSKS